MKRIISFFILLFLNTVIHAQSAPAGSAHHNFKYKIDFEIRNSKGRNLISTPYLSPFNFIFQKDIAVSYSDTANQIGGILLGVVYGSSAKVVTNSGHIASFSKLFRVVSNLDTSDMQVIACGITPENKKFFRYHIISNHTTILTDWTTPDLFEQEYQAEKPYAVLWKGKSFPDQIYIEIYDIRNFENREGVMLSWDSRTKSLPKIADIFAYKRNIENDVPVQKGYYFKKDSVSSPFFSKFNTEYNFPEDLHFRQNDFGDFIFYFDVIPGQFYTAAIRELETGEYRYTRYKSADPALQIGSEIFSKPGKYAIEIYNVNGDENAKGDKLETLVIPVEVFPPPPGEKTFTLKQIMIYTAAITLVAAFTFYLYHRRNKRNISTLELQQQLIKLQLQSVRNQLNPHFVYNALSGIQNLLNKKDNEGANNFLKRFSRLSRQVLENSEKDLIAIEDEVKLLDDYLQMEKLRFGFSYLIKVDKLIDQANTEIPAMLLQPFVENAVKHGVCSKEDGVIEICFTKVEGDIKVTITDNGSGFAGNTQTGRGNRLSENRIALLNGMYKNAPITLDVKTNTAGTEILINLKDWVE